MWEECQFQKKNNSRAYSRTLTYIFLQKLLCPKCGKILGGKASKKKGHEYFYYYCRDCKLTVKEKDVEEHFKTFVDELTEYDSIVNQFFVPMIIKNFDEPRENITKEIETQKARLERAKLAYVDGAFSLDDYKEKAKQIEDTIEMLQDKINTADKCDTFTYSAKDILVARDIAFINKGIHPEEYDRQMKPWKKRTREEKSDLIMNYVDNVELTLCGKNKVKIGEVFFRESMCKPCNDLYDAGFLAKKDYAILGNIGMKLRFSEYLPIEKVSEIVFTLSSFNVSST